jgi:hypothetical protein
MARSEAPTMNLLETLAAAGGGSIMREIGQSVGANEAQAKTAIEQLLPALARGIQRNAAQPGGLESLLGALKNGSHQRYVDQPEDLSRPEAIQDGNAILGHILGSEDVSRNVAGRAAAETGLAPDLLKKMLPMLAAAVMGSLGKQTSGGGGLASLAGGGDSGGADLGGMLSSFLDADGDGSALDDVLGMAKKFF